MSPVPASNTALPPSSSSGSSKKVKTLSAAAKPRCKDCITPVIRLTGSNIIIMLDRKDMKSPALKSELPACLAAV